MSRSVGELLSEQLRLLGCARLYRNGASAERDTRPLGDLSWFDANDDDQALLLADADGRLSGGYGAALVAGPILHVSSQPGGRAEPRTVASADELIDVLAALGAVSTPTTVALHVDVDLDEPAAASLVARLDVPSGVAVTLNASFADAMVAVVVGPGVVRAGHIEGLREMAVLGGLGVVNTWGAKGVFRWDSPFHFGTAGLQARDFELAGVTAADIVVTCGLDPSETPLDLLGSFVIQDVEPWQLPALVANWPRSDGPPEARPALYAALAAVVTPMYESTTTPIEAPRAALHLSGACPEGGVVVADAGAVGFWLARTFPTGVAGSVVVPAIAQPGFAAAAGIVARLAGRPCVAVVDGPLDSVTEGLLELAERHGVGFGVQVWGHDGVLDDVSEHVAMTQRGFGAEVITIDDVPIGEEGLEELVEVAGPIVAWAGEY